MCRVVVASLLIENHSTVVSPIEQMRDMTGNLSTRNMRQGAVR